MENLKIAICDDEMAECRLLTHMIEKTYPGLHPDCFQDGDEFLRSFKPGSYDLIFMDILMPGLDGVSVTEGLRAKDPAVPIAFTTGSTDHAMAGYKYHVIRYLVKPYRPEDVKEVLDLAAREKENRPKLTLRISGRDMSFEYDKIIYMEQNSHTLYLNLVGGATLQLTGKLDDVEAKLPPEMFMRCHKSFLVNLRQVKTVDKDLNVFEMQNGESVHIRRESVREAIQKLKELSGN